MIVSSLQSTRPPIRRIADERHGHQEQGGGAAPLLHLLGSDHLRQGVYVALMISLQSPSSTDWRVFRPSLTCILHASLSACIDLPCTTRTDLNKFEDH